MDFRPKSRTGLWLVWLLPLAFISSNSPAVLHLQSHVIATNVAFVMSLYSTMFALNSFPCVTLKTFIALMKAPATVITNDRLSQKSVAICVLILWGLSAFKVTLLSCILSSVALAAFVWLLPHVFINFRRSFSYGEGCLVLQSVVIFCTKALASFCHEELDPTTIPGSFHIIAVAGLGSLCFLCSISYIPVMSFINNSSIFYAMGLSTICGFTLPFLWWKLKRNPVMWVLQTIFTSKSILGLFAIWSFCLTMAILLVILQASKATTATRKYFHGIVVVVFTSGAVIDPDFLYLSSIVGLCFMLLLEHMRFKSIEPISTWLNSAFKTFRDEKDVGDLILTNIYLLAGVALPLWLSQDLRSGNPTVLLSGVLAVGIGDSFASVVGSKFGRLKIASTNKSVEGLIASVLSQVAFLLVLSRLNLLSFQASLILPITIVSAVETFTSQVDNIALPFLMYIFLNLI